MFMHLFDSHSYSWLQIEQGERIHAVTTLVAVCSSWITVGAVASEGTINCC